MQARIRRRYRSERLFRGLGFGALALAAGFLLFLLTTVIAAGWSSFRQTQVLVPVVISAERLGVTAAEAKAAEEAFGTIAAADARLHGRRTPRRGRDLRVCGEGFSHKLPDTSSRRRARRC